MKLKLACADFAFPLLPHDRVLDLIAMLEFDGVDIGLFEGRSHLWPSREFKSLAKSGKALGRKLADRGLRCADVFLQMNPDFIPYAINHPEAARRLRMVDGVRNEIRIHLKKNIGAAQPAIRQLAAKCFSRFGEGLEFPRRPKMRAAFKESNVHAVELQHGDQIKDPVVWKQRERKIGAGEL